MKFAQKLQKQKNAVPEIMKLVKMGDPHYQKMLKESEGVYMVTQRIKNIIESLKLTAQNEKAISLSCPQIGFNYRIFIMLKKFENNKWSYDNIQINDYETFINPFKIKQSQLNQVEWEECPSYPFLMGKMERSQKIMIKYQNENDQIIQRWVEDFEARVIQHELEHLQGLTIERPDSMLMESKRCSFESEEYDLSHMEQQNHGMELMMKNMKIQQSIRKK